MYKQYVSKTYTNFVRLPLAPFTMGIFVRPYQSDKISHYQDFYFLDSSMNTQCLNLWLDTAYCVQAVRDISTYPSYPYSMSAIYTITKPAYVTTTSVLTPNIPTTTSVVALPRAPDTESNCKVYVNYIRVEPFQDQSEAEDLRIASDELISCNFTSPAYPVYDDDFWY